MTKEPNIQKILEEFDEQFTKEMNSYPCQYDDSIRLKAFLTQKLREAFEVVKPEEYVDVSEIWKIDKSGKIDVLGEPLAVLANGVPIYIKEGYVIENSKVAKEVMNGKYNF